MNNKYKDSWECTCASYGFCVLHGRRPKIEKRYGKPVHISTIMLDVLKGIENKMKDTDKKASNEL